MKKITILFAILIAISFETSASFGQKRPIKKTTAPVSKPTVTKTPEVESTPIPTPIPTPTPTLTPTPTPVEVSPAQTFFNQGLKCDAKDTHHLDF